jgi:MFS family permease
LPISAVDSITPAIEHTRQQLFQPFRIGQWTKLAFVGLLAGELGSNGCNRSNFHLPVRPHTVPDTQFPGSGFPGIDSLGIDPALMAAIMSAVVAAVFAAVIIGIVLMYVSSVMRFVLFDSIIARECHIRSSWSRRLVPGWRYFAWKLVYIFICLAGIAVLVGIPLAFAIAHGWFKQPKEHMAPLAFGGVILILLSLVFLVAVAVIFVLTKDFVIPQMALEDIDAFEGWRRLWAMMQADIGAYAGYIAMKIVLAIVAGILIAIAAVIVGLFFAIPTVGLSLLAILTGKSAGLTWNAYTITLAIVVGSILLGIFLYLVSLISVPAIVFFPAYSMYFFAGRYPRLSAVLYPAAPPVQVPTGATPGLAPPSL